MEQQALWAQPQAEQTSPIATELQSSPVPPQVPSLPSVLVARHMPSKKGCEQVLMEMDHSWTSIMSCREYTRNSSDIQFMTFFL